MTEKTLDWLNLNRFRAYPFVNDEGLVCNGARIPDCVLLDCIVVDTRALENIPEMIFTGYSITDDYTRVFFSYNGEAYSYDISSSAGDSETSIVKVEGTGLQNANNEYLYIKLVLSSHNYILQKAGKGQWTFKGKILPTKIISSTVSGVSGISVNGSANVSGFENSGTASGNVHLVDGFRTQPVVQNGKVLVKVGEHYGEDPCHYNEDTESDSNDGAICDDLLLFFCGQNAVNSSNVVLQGGPGISIKQGGSYTAKSDIVDTYGEVGVRRGEKIPCIEVVASSELMRIYRPSAQQS